MRKTFGAFLISAILLTIFSTTVDAAAAQSLTGYGWSESLGYFDFNNTVLSDDSLSGNAYNDNTGFIALNVNRSGNTLSGYGWSESVGYFDFSGVTIASDHFVGYAYNDNTGFLNMSGVSIETITGSPTVTTSSGRVVTTFDSAKKEQELNILKYSFPRYLKYKMTGEDVRDLQKLLNSLGYGIAQVPDPGSLGHETNYFGARTRAALIRFQIANTIVPASGYFGPATQSLMKTKGYIK